MAAQWVYVDRYSPASIPRVDLDVDRDYKLQLVNTSPGPLMRFYTQQVQLNARVIDDSIEIRDVTDQGGGLIEVEVIKRKYSPNGAYNFQRFLDYLAGVFSPTDMRLYIWGESSSTTATQPGYWGPLSALDQYAGGTPPAPSVPAPKAPPASGGGAFPLDPGPVLVGAAVIAIVAVFLNVTS